MFTDPEKNLRAFGLGENMIVADLGAGSGFYTIGAAKIVSRGKVYAIEIQKDFLITIKNKIKEFYLNNVECLLGDVEKIGGTKLGSSVIDAVIASNIFSQVKDKENFIKEIKRILKTKGRVLLIDWVPHSPVVGSSAHKIVSKETAKEMFGKEGLFWQKDINVGSHHYGIILENK